MKKKEKDNILLEDYTRLKKIGDGGYATVYKVRHNELEYIRAIRVLKDDVENEDDPIYQKFIKECKILLRLGNGNHPNIVHIYQPLFKSNKAFVEMDYITGENITEYIERVKFIPIEEVIKFVKEIGSALAYCHEDIYKYCYDRELDNLQDDPEDGSKPLIDEKKRKELIKKYQVIHNDIHSGNIMRRDDGHYILLDFGLSIQNGNVTRKSQRTNGAPEYKSPEKWENDADVSTQSDIYSFGIVLYEMLTGHVPFIFNKATSEMNALNALMKAHQGTTPKPVAEEREKNYQKHIGGRYDGGVPQWIIDIVNKCLEKKPENRFKNGAELLLYIENKDDYKMNNEILSLKEEITKLEKEISELRTIDNETPDHNPANGKHHTIDTQTNNQKKKGKKNIGNTHFPKNAKRNIGRNKQNLSSTNKDNNNLSINSEEKDSVANAQHKSQQLPIIAKNKKKKLKL